MNVAEGAGMHEADRRVMTMGRASVAALCPAATLAAAATPAALGSTSSVASARQPKKALCSPVVDAQTTSPPSRPH
jgi:hypothetical protein